MKEEIITDEIITDEPAPLTPDENSGEKPRNITMADVLARLWICKYLIIIILIVGAAIGFVIANGIPPTYRSVLRMVPEAAKTSGGASAALAALGVGTDIETEDAYSPTLYPDIVASIPFITSLFDVEVQTSKSDTTYTLRQYLEYKTTNPWWDTILDKGEEEEIEKSADEIIDPFQLSKGENDLYNFLKNSVSVRVDRRTAEVAIAVIMQDPLVAAQLTDTVAARLQEYITDYRTAKARHDLDYAIEINEEAKKQYYEAQQTYAEYMDRNQSLALYSAQTTRDRLENEMKLAFNLYNQTSQQLQQCEAKVQEVTPVFAVVNPSTVAITPWAPKKSSILFYSVLFSLFIALLISCLPLFFSKAFFNRITSSISRQRNKNKDEEKGDGYEEDEVYEDDGIEENYEDYQPSDDNYVLDDDYSRYAPGEGGDGRREEKQ